MKKCANEKCFNVFEPKTVSNIYCGSECRDFVSNENNKAKYHRNKARERGHLVRVCLICNITKLSRYNKKEVCEPCQEQKNANVRKKLLTELGIL